MSDGPITNGSGTPYLYMSDLDLTAKDIQVGSLRINKKKNTGTFLYYLLERQSCHCNGITGSIRLLQIKELRS